jgi:hypothetical protein
MHNSLARVLTLARLFLALCMFRVLRKGVRKKNSLRSPVLKGRVAHTHDTEPHSRSSRGSVSDEHRCDPILLSLMSTGFVLSSYLAVVCVGCVMWEFDWLCCHIITCRGEEGNPSILCVHVKREISSSFQ